MSHKARFDKLLDNGLHVDGCDPEREHQAALRIARAAFVAGWVARGRNFYTLGASRTERNRLRRLDTRTVIRAWEGKS